MQEFNRLVRRVIQGITQLFQTREPDLTPWHHPATYDPHSRHEDYLDDTLPGMPRGAHGDDHLAGYPRKAGSKDYLAGFPRRAGIAAGHCWRPPEAPRLPVSD